MAIRYQKKVAANNEVVPSAAPARRKFLKGAAAAAAAVVGSGLIDGFPLIWAQNMKDVKLVQVGGSYSAIIDIARQATKDLGFQVEMQTAPHDALLNRLVTQPTSIDIADIEYFFQVHMLGRNILHPIDLNKIKFWDKIVPVFTKGEYPDGKKVSTQGILPFEVQYIEKPGDKKFAKGPTRYATGIPTVYNADTLGIRPDLIKRPIESWKEILNPEFKGKAALVDVPSIGIMDAAMAIEARGDIKYRDKGNMTKDEIDKIARFRQLTEEQTDLLLAARKSPGQYTEGVVLTDHLTALFRNVPPAIALALGMTEKEEKAQRADLMKKHKCTELEAIFMVAEQISVKRGRS